MHEHGPIKYAVEYLLKWETVWRRTMDQPLSNLASQEKILWENPAMVATKMIAYCECVRLLTPGELLASKETAPV